MSAAADNRNRDRTLMVWLTGIMPGVTLVPPGDESAPIPADPRWVRVQVDEVSSALAGYRGGNRVVSSQILVTLDVFTRGQQLGEAQVDGADAVASTLRSSLTAASLPLVDYVADATGATTLAGCTIRFASPPTVRSAPSASGVQRRQVLAPAIYLHEV